MEAGIELTDETSIAALRLRLGGTPLDAVILNAGILAATEFDMLEAESIRRQTEVNALAPLLLARALVDLMHRGAKLVLMTNRMGSIDDNSSGGYYGYRMSKAALNCAGRSLAIDLQPRGIRVCSAGPHRWAHPGEQRHFLACQR